LLIALLEGADGSVKLIFRDIPDMTFVVNALGVRGYQRQHPALHRLQGGSAVSHHRCYALGVMDSYPCAMAMDYLGKLGEH
jgi:hypothetical protein